MNVDPERIKRIEHELEEAKIDLLVCTLPVNVLLLSGYWPVVGTSVAVANSSGRVVLIVPEDESELAELGWADEVRTFSAGSLFELKSTIDVVASQLVEVLKALNVRRGRVLGYEFGPTFEPSSYVAMHMYGSAIGDLLHHAARYFSLRSAHELLVRLRSVLTPRESDRVRVACRFAEAAFLDGARQLHTGLTETEVAAMFRAPLSTRGMSHEGVARADGFTFCMSGPNSAEAYAAYQRSRARRIESGDLVLVHCNSYADGYWTDITRTFCSGETDDLKLRMYDAVFAARRAAIEAVRPGVKASEVDAAARQVLTERGFGEAFKHGLGHGVGFAAIDHNATPRLHPASPDVLEVGMIFNVEPAIYLQGYGGLRHCDVVLVTEEGAEVLTPFQSKIAELTVT